MLVTAEMRWFWRGAPPAGMGEWFHDTAVHAGAAGGGKARTVEYVLDPAQVELGIKRRRGKRGAEIKGLVAAHWGDVSIGPFSGTIELWTRWTSEALDIELLPRISLEKRRWLRTFDTSTAAAYEVPLDESGRPLGQRPRPPSGCHVEWTHLTFAGGERFFSLAFEAFGKVRSVEMDLCAVAVLLASRRPPALRGGELASYPAFLARHAPGRASL